MSKTDDTTSRFFEILHKMGKTANIMIRPSTSSSEKELCEPLMLRWGYIEDLEKNNTFFKNAIQSFDSPIKWALHDTVRTSPIFPNGFVRWWLLYPAKLDEIVEQEKCDLDDASAWVSKNEPSLALQSNKEFKRFVDHLAASYEHWKASSLK